MANTEHLELLSQGVEVWNRWREKHPDIQPDLYKANLSFLLSEGNWPVVSMSRIPLCQIDLSGANLSRANLRSIDFTRANLCGAKLYEANLRGSNLSHANLQGADLREANLSFVGLVEADLSGANMHTANLRDADLREANLSQVVLHSAVIESALLRRSDLNRSDLGSASLCGSSLQHANLSGANLSGTNLSSATLNSANLQGAGLVGSILNQADLSNAILSAASLTRSQALATNFEKAVFTGACLGEWHINSATSFDGAVCEYIYLKAKYQERRPREGSFKLGEFAALFQQAVDTVDLIFKDGIDWQAFFQSFQDLRSQYSDQDISIQAIEKKRGGAFVVRLEVAEDADKKAIEGSAKELYETKLALIEQRYRAELQAKDGEIVAYREQSANLMKITEMLAARPPMSETPKYDMRGAQFAGGFAETVQGDQIGGTINNYGPNTEDITRLLAALRDQAQTFPTDQKDEANEALDLLEPELKAEQPDQNRISRQLKKLVALGAAIGTIASGAAAISGDVSTFTGNVIELTEKLGIPIEQVQLPPSGTP